MMVRGHGWLEAHPLVQQRAASSLVTWALRERREARLRLALQRFLVASYAYYILNETVMSDVDYDKVAMFLLKGWDEFDHMHKHLVTRGDLEAGTLYALKAEDYPGMVRGAATHLIYEMGKKK